jgi:hypothetical protein
MYAGRTGGTLVMDAERAEALEVLRDLWRGQSQGAANLADRTESSCKRMTDAGVGFDEFGAAGEEDRAAAWRSRLEREGKLGTAGSLADLVLRPASTGHSTGDEAANDVRPSTGR